MKYSKQCELLLFVFKRRRRSLLERL